MFSMSPTTFLSFIANNQFQFFKLIVWIRTFMLLINMLKLKCILWIHSISDTKCVGFFPYQQTPQQSGRQLGVLHFNYDTEYLQTPQDKGLVPQNCPPFQMLIRRSKSPEYPYFYLFGLQIGLSHGSLLKFSDLL